MELKEMAYRIQDDIPCCANCVHQDLIMEVIGQYRICELSKEEVKDTGICREFSY